MPICRHRRRIYLEVIYYLLPARLHVPSSHSDRNVCVYTRVGVYENYTTAVPQLKMSKTKFQRTRRETGTGSVYTAAIVSRLLVVVVVVVLGCATKPFFRIYTFSG